MVLNVRLKYACATALVMAVHPVVGENGPNMYQNKRFIFTNSVK